MNHFVYTATLAAALCLIGILLYRNRSLWLAWVAIFGFGIFVIALPLFFVRFGLASFGYWSIGIFGGITALFALLTFLFWKKARISASLFALVAMLLGVVAADALWLEPRSLEVRHERLVTAKVSRPIRVVVLSDIQTDVVGGYERSVLLRAAEEKPDLVLLPGDYLQIVDPAKRNEQKVKWRQIFADKPLKPSLGAYAVQGDMEWYGIWEDLFDGSGVQVFSKTGSKDLGEIYLSGLTLADSNKSARGLSGPEEGKFHIVFGHKPEYFLKDPPGDLLIAGHTHGGQVQIPGFGPLITYSKVPRDWAGGCFLKRANGQYLLISRGIGMERADAPRLRFFCKPEIVVVDLIPRS